MKKLASIEKLENWIDSYLNFEKTPKKNIFWLDTMRFFCEKFGQPQDFAPCFHVAGSKGKGSVSTFIASILDEAGFKTGLYTSPHILDFIERVSSPSGAFEEETYNRATEEIMSGVKAIPTEELPGQRPITWFELVTLFSFLVFRQAKVDWSVFEVGLGGRLDSTNIVNPKISVITPIELEHTEFLGDTLEKIAFEKGGIIKENTPVVIARQRPEVRKVFEKIAKEKHARAIFVEDAIQNLSFEIKNISNCIKNNTILTNDSQNFKEDSIKNHTTSQGNKNISLMNVSFSSNIFKRPIQTGTLLIGRFQAENAALAALAVKTALPNISEDAIERGLAKAKLPARFEIVQNPKGFENIPFLVMDGAHTVNSVRFTMETMNQVFGKTDGRKESENQIPEKTDEGSQNTPVPRTLLFACAADKDAKDIAPLFKNQFESVFLTKPGNVKQSDLEKLAKAFDKAEISYDLNEDFESQIKKAFEHANAHKSILLVTGSFYLIAEVKKFLINVHSRDTL
ncbi:folylpolyglutamate synthase/dihydrofolate synthase family protein [Treponema sp.]|uniref:bifunctional folylpolyglutamate synthase/dihydrofolate synthase n=1 Tax=Treponema sp. TaxID=166 RepID=UPI0025F09FB4|nr:folylpolyglutamate synthase/dihydrofolate synthase family protein [Treponema sp.]MBR4322672.1 bifunctional folylpolyglutamate synthase/dihydrofolate synthase [Treponema sp.]